MVTPENVLRTLLRRIGRIFILSTYGVIAGVFLSTLKLIKDGLWVGETGQIQKVGEKWLFSNTYSDIGFLLTIS